jgi:pyrroloquinoline-quinone synthase
MDAVRATQVTQFAEQAINDGGLRQNPYLQALKSGAMSAEQFRRTQEQFFFAVSFFPRPMAALVGRIPEPKARLDILQNLVEEHGEFREEAFHHTTFQQFLRSIGSDPGKLDALALWSCVRAFNSVLTCACVLDELEVGIGCIGVIEYSFADISHVIGQAVVNQGWVAAEKLVHYRLHAEIDRKHADDFFAIIEPAWSEPRKRYNIQQGVRMGVYIFDRLYSDLLAQAK